MSKYERIFKPQLAKRAQNKSTAELSRSLNVSLGQIEYWLHFYF